MSDNVRTGFGKYVWIIGPASLIGIFAILGMLGLNIECEEIKVCDELHCEFYCNVTNPTYSSVYLFNHDDWPIVFSPEVENMTLYSKYYGRWRFTNFTRETRFPNIPSERLYVYVFPRYSTKEFKIVVDAKEAALIKYDFNTLDPYLLTYDYIYTEKENITPVYKTEVVIVKPECVTFKNGTETCYDGYNYTRQVFDKYNITYVKTDDRLGINIGNTTIISPVNVKDDKLMKWDVPIGDRNFEEYGRCRSHELEKGVCTETNIITELAVIK